MPTYDYVCDSCDHAFELFQQMTAPVKKKCPSCGKLKLRRLIGAGAGVIFKGSGFYQTDYRSDAYTKAAESDKKASTTKPDSKGDSKGDLKSADRSSDKPADKSSKSDKSGAADASKSKTAKKKAPGKG